MTQTAQKRVDERQMALNWLMGAYRSRKLMAPSEVAGVLRCKLDHVYDLIDEGKLLALAPEDRERRRYQIDVRSVETCLALRALYGDEDYFRMVTDVLDRLQRPEAERAIRHLTQRLSRL